MITLNADGPHTAVFNYAVHAHRAAAGTQFLNIDLGGRLGPWGLGETARGLHTKFYPLDMAANSVFPRIFLPTAREAVHEALRAREPVHYASLAVPPFGGSDLEFATIHDSPQTSLHRGLYSDRAAYRFLQRRRLRQYSQFRHLLTGTRYVRDGLLRYGVSARVTVLLHPVAPTLQRVPGATGEIRRRLGLPEDAQLVLSVSSAEPRKNLGILPEVMDRLGSTFRLVRVGPSVRGALNFEGISEETLKLLYSACDVLLFPSFEEGLGLPVAEAMTCGLPVVASDIPVIREVSAGAARLADPTLAAELARAVREVVGAPEEWVRKGYQRSQVYRFDRFAEAFRVFLSQLDAAGSR